MGNSNPIGVDFCAQPFNVVQKIMHKSMRDIRRMYDKFIQMKGDSFSFYLDKQNFLNLLTEFVRENPEEIYAIFASGRDMNSKASFMDFISVTIVYSRSNWLSKVRLLFRMFDFDKSNTITLDEMTILGSCFCRGICHTTGQDIPRMSDMKKIINTVFLIIDQVPDCQVTMNEMTRWVANSDQMISLFRVYEPKQKIKVNPAIFRGVNDGKPLEEEKKPQEEEKKIKPRAQAQRKNIGEKKPHEEEKKSKAKAFATRKRVSNKSPSPTRKQPSPTRLVPTKLNILQEKEIKRLFKKQAKGGQTVKVNDFVRYLIKKKMAKSTIIGSIGNDRTTLKESQMLQKLNTLSAHILQPKEDDE